MKYEKLELKINEKLSKESDNKSKPVYNPATNDIIGDWPHDLKNRFEWCSRIQQRSF